MQQFKDIGYRREVETGRIQSLKEANHTRKNHIL